MSGLVVLGKNGEEWWVENGTGLGVRQHDDVMLTYGYSHKAGLIKSIPAGQYAILSLTIPANLTHHAESRFIEAFNGELRAKLILGLTPLQLPTVVEQLPAFNQVGPVYNPNVKSLVKWHGVSVSDPLAGLINANNTVDNLHLHGVTGQGVRSAGPASSSDITGRHYTEGTYVLWIHNPSLAEVELTYIYKWHEIEKD